MVKIRNILIIFLVSGFWHGANWTFILWGLYNALLFLPLLLTDRNRVNVGQVASGKLLPSIRESLQMILTFLLTVIGWVFFRSENIHQAFAFLAGIGSSSLFYEPGFIAPKTFLMIALMFGMEWIQRMEPHPLAIDKWILYRPLRWAVYYGLIGLIFIFGGKQQTFIYFQF